MLTTYQQAAVRLTDLHAVGGNLAECRHVLGEFNGEEPDFGFGIPRTAYALMYEPLKIYQLILTDETFAAFFVDWIGRWANVEDNVKYIVMGYRSPTEIDFNIFWNRGGHMNGGLIKHGKEWGSHT